MSTQLPTTQLANLDAASSEADSAAVLDGLVTGVSLDPAVTERVHARAERVTNDIRRARGLVDDDTFQSLLEEEA